MLNAPSARIVGWDSRIVLMDLEIDNMFRSISSQHIQVKTSRRISGGIVSSVAAGFMLLSIPFTGLAPMSTVGFFVM